MPAFPPRSRQRVGTIALVGAIMVLMGWSYLLTIVTTRSADLVTHTIEAIAATDRLTSTVVDAETGQRGYIITSDRTFLEPYERAKASADQALTELAALTADNDGQSARMSRLSALLQDKFAEMQETNAAVDAGDTGRAIAIVLETRGKMIMDQIRAVIEEVKAEEVRLLNARQITTNAQNRWTTVPIIISIVALILLGWLEMRRYSAQNFDLRTSNIQLDEIVQERTRALESEKLRVEALLQDVTHRIGNNLSMVSSLLNVQRRQSRNPEVAQALSDAQGRIAAIAAGQRRLQLDMETDEIQAKPYLENLLAETARQAAERGIRLTHDIEDVRLPGRDAISYIVLTNELTTNALKHAFREGDSGEIHVSLNWLDIDGERMVELVVEDDGHGLAHAMPAAGETGPHPVSKGGGLGQNIVQTLLRSMRATITSSERWPERGRKGYRNVIRIPLAESVPAT